MAGSTTRGGGADGGEEADDSFELSGSVALYAAMLGGTVVGQLVGIIVDVLLESHSRWIPAVCSVVLEAIAGARLGATRSGGPLSVAQSVRLSATYSGALVAVSIPLAVWVAAARPALASGIVAHGWPAAFGAVLAVVAIATVARSGLMVVLSWSHR
jgi:hypothetical protein